MKVKLINGGIMPKRGKERDAGFDIFLPQNVILRAHTTETISTGVCIELPEGYAAQFVVRSSMSRKGLIIQPPLIDELYRGELHIMAANFTDADMIFRAGERICSLLVFPIFTGELELADELSDTIRGADWSGSTGK